MVFGLNGGKKRAKNYKNLQKVTNSQKYGKKLQFLRTYFGRKKRITKFNKGSIPAFWVL